MFKKSKSGSLKAMYTINAVSIAVFIIAIIYKVFIDK